VRSRHRPLAKRSTVLLGDAHRMGLDLLTKCLEDEFEIVARTTDLPGFVAEAARLKPEIAVIGMTIPFHSELQLGRQLRDIHPTMRLVYLESEDEVSRAAAAFAVGAAAYLLRTRPADEFLAGMRVVASGGSFLSPAVAGGNIETLSRQHALATPTQLSEREIKVITQLVAGFTMKEIGRRLGISPSTVAFHKYSAMRKMDLHGKTALMEFAVREGLLQVR